MPAICFLRALYQQLPALFPDYQPARTSHINAMSAKPAALSRPTPWRDVIILCRKCGKKCHGGFGPKRKQSLKDTLRQALRDVGRRRQVRIMETSCLGICPKDGVTALNATSPGTIHVIPAGADGLEVVRTLLGDRPIADMAPVAEVNRVETA
jgi:hypothetical protein